MTTKDGFWQAGQRTIWISAALILMFGLATCGTTDAPAPHWPDCPTAVGPTGNNATLILPQSLGLRRSDAISIWTDDEVCAGMEVVTWDTRSHSLSIWGDDSQTPAKDGAAGGDTLRMRVHIERQVAFVLSDTSANWRTVPTYASDAIYTVAAIDLGGGSEHVIDSLSAVVGQLESDLGLARDSLTAQQAATTAASQRGDSLQVVVGQQATTISDQQSKITDAINVLTG